MLALTMDSQPVTAPAGAAIRVAPRGAGRKAPAGIHLSVLWRGVRPLRGRSDVLGEGDRGLIPMIHPHYQRGAGPEIHERFEETGRALLDPNEGLTAAEAAK
jgi:hypothetical protein